MDHRRLKLGAPVLEASCRRRRAEHAEATPTLTFPPLEKAGSLENWIR